MSIVLIGPPAAGKTRVGKRLAKRVGKPFVDTDQAIVDKHGPIPAIFAAQGEPRFRRLERAEVRAALSLDAVVSLGGGAVLDPDTRSDLRSRFVVLLTISPEAASERIGNDKRPLVTGLDAWKALVASRAELYASVAALTLDTSFRKPDAIVEELVGLLQTQGFDIPSRETMEPEHDPEQRTQPESEPDQETEGERAGADERAGAERRS